MKDKIGELKDCTAHAHDLATDFDFDFDWIIGILTTTVPKGKCYENLSYAYRELCTVAIHCILYYSMAHNFYHNDRK